MKNVVDMTLEEFAEELRRIRDEAWFVKRSTGARQHRSYMNQQRGDFYGKDKKCQIKKNT